MGEIATSTVYSDTAPLPPHEGAIWYDTSVTPVVVRRCVSRNPAVWEALNMGSGGAQGPPGPEGPQGIQGDPGVSGSPGADGAPGAQGLQGDAGLQGTQGIQGVPGNDGAAGTQGTQGIQGIPGNDGAPGTPGGQGIQGLPGNDGAPGSQGIQGIQGVQGPPGAGNGYVLSGNALNLAVVADATIYYFGSLGLAPQTTAGNCRIYVPKAGTIKTAYVYAFAGTAGSAENWQMIVRVNNTTDVAVQTLASNSANRVWANAGLNTSVVVGDYFEFKSAAVTWVTNPANLRLAGWVYIE
jgi:hypothetical protein